MHSFSNELFTKSRVNDNEKNYDMYQSTDMFQPKYRKEKSLPKLYKSSMSRERSRQSYFIGIGTTTYENERKEKERKTRNRSFIREVRQKKSLNNLESSLKELNKGFVSFISSNQHQDVKDRYDILLHQSDALFEKMLDHLCNLSLTRQQEAKYKSMIAEYRESFKIFKVSYCDELNMSSDTHHDKVYSDDTFRGPSKFKHDLTSTISQGFQNIIN